MDSVWGSSETMEVDHNVQDGGGDHLSRISRRRPHCLIRHKFGGTASQHQFGGFRSHRRGITMLERPPVDVFVRGSVDIGSSAKEINDYIHRASSCFAHSKDGSEYFTSFASEHDNFIISQLSGGALERLEDNDEFGALFQEPASETGSSHKSASKIKQGKEGEPIPNQKEEQVLIQLPEEEQATGGGVLTLEMLSDVNDLALAGSPSETIAHIEHIRVTRKDLATLRTTYERGWLPDPVIDLYLELLRRESRGTNRKVYAFESSCCELFMKKNELPELRDFGTGNNTIFSNDIIFFPVLKGGDHWMLLVVNIPDKKISSYNSIPGSDDMYLDKVEEFVKEEEVKKSVRQSKWTKVNARVPQQDNGHDCGVFILQFARYICRGRERFDFTANDMPYIRERILHECWNWRQPLLPD